MLEHLKTTFDDQCCLSFFSTFPEAILWRQLKWAGATRKVVINLKLGLIGVSRGISSVSSEWGRFWCTFKNSCFCISLLTFWLKPKAKNTQIVSDHLGHNFHLFSYHLFATEDKLYFLYYARSPIYNYFLSFLPLPYISPLILFCKLFPFLPDHLYISPLIFFCKLFSLFFATSIYISPLILFF